MRRLHRRRNSSRLIHIKNIGSHTSRLFDDKYFFRIDVKSSSPFSRSRPTIWGACPSSIPMFLIKSLSNLFGSIMQSRVVLRFDTFSTLLDQFLLCCFSGNLRRKPSARTGFRDQFYSAMRQLVSRSSSIHAVVQSFSTIELEKDAQHYRR